MTKDQMINYMANNIIRFVRQAKCDSSLISCVFAFPLFSHSKTIELFSSAIHEHIFHDRQYSQHCIDVLIGKNKINLIVLNQTDNPFYSQFITDIANTVQEYFDDKVEVMYA